MDRRLHNRAHRANESFPLGSNFEWGLHCGSSGAYIAHFPRSFISRAIRLHGRGVRIPPCSRNEGSSTRVLAIFGIEFSWSSEGSPQRKSCWVRAASWSSRFRQNPLCPIRSTKPPTFLVSAGQAICEVLKRAPGGSAVFSEWRHTDELSWSVSQGSTLWGSYSVSLDASE